MAAGGDKYVLAIDMGSGSAKAVLVSNRAGVAGSGLRPIGTNFIPGGGAEQDPEEWWSAVTGAARAALAEAAIAPEQIIAIACTTQWSVTVPVDGDGNALGNAISWMDTRGGRYNRAVADGWPRIKGYGLSRVIKWIRLTGGAPTQSGMDGLGHVLFLKHERPEIYARARAFLEPMDYLNLRLTGRFAAVRGRGGPGEEHECFDERWAWEQELGRDGWIGLGRGYETQYWPLQPYRACWICGARLHGRIGTAAVQGNGRHTWRGEGNCGAWEKTPRGLRFGIHRRNN